MELAGRIVTEDGLVEGTLSFGHSILEVRPGTVDCDDYLLPGFVDLHVHGGGGGDAMQGEEGLRQACRFHGRHGTTSLLATTLSAPLEELEGALLGVAAVHDAPGPGEAAVLGAHLEGPYLNPERLGAQPRHARAPEAWEVDRLLELAPVRVLTLAPEVAGGLDLIRTLVARDVRVQIGHTAADYELTRTALESGAAGVTHLFNAMASFHHRGGGAVGAALAHATYAEVIADLLHVDAGGLRVADRCIPGWYAVTDAVAAAGMPDGAYPLGDQMVCKAGASITLEDGTLAGSALTMDGALRNLVHIGLDLVDAARRLATIPCAYLGLRDRGSIRPGARADLVVIDSDLQLREVFIGGQPIRGC